MKTFFGIAFSFLLLTATVSAQSGCAGLQFQTAAQQTAWTNPVGSALLRQADGSFTQETYSLVLAMPMKTASVPNFQSNFLNCLGLPARTRQPGPPKLGTDSLGTGSRNPAIIDLAGTGLPSVLGLWQSMVGDRLLVGLVNPDLSPKNVTSYPVGPGSISVLTGDFNGDGKHDAAVIYGGPDSGATPGGVSLLIGNGDGTLQQAVNYPVGKYATAGVAWDFNGDGRTDLAIAAYDSSSNPFVTILTGNANGTLTVGATYALTGGQTVNSLAAGDLNGDGIADLLVTTYKGLAVLYGVAGGTFQPPTYLTSSPHLGFVATGDFNKDGKLDFAISDRVSGSGDVFIYLNQGNGSFATPVGYYIGYEPEAFYVEDVDGDGNLDLAFAAGHPDALTAEKYYNYTEVLFGNGDGSFTGAASYPVTSTSGSVAATADFNGDGVPDIVTASILLIGKGKGAFNPAMALPLGSLAPYFIVTGDFNGDGKPDMIFAEKSGGLYLMVNNGGTLAAPVAIPGSSGSGYLVAGDFNGDKKLDLAVAQPAANSIAIYLGNGDGTFQARTLVTVGNNPNDIAAVDLNGDGKLDLAVANMGSVTEGTTGSLSILTGNGNGTFQAANYPTLVNPQFVTAGDFNGDSKPDLILSGQDSSFNFSLVELKGNGNGTFQPGVEITTEFGCAKVQVADFNGDGKLDMIVPHCCGYTDLTYYLGNGDGTFQPETVLQSGQAVYGAVADLNGDGKPDLIVANGYVGYAQPVSVLLNVTPAPNLPAIAPGGVVSAASFGAFPSVAPGTWMEIYGSNLAPDTRQWGAADFTGNTAPNSLDGVKVTIGGQLAFVDYISPTQVNAQVPSNVAAGSARMTVATPSGTSSPYSITVNATQPGLLAPATFNIGGKQYVVAQFADGSYVLPPDSIAGLTTRQAKPGETIVIYGIGFGSVTPAIAAGQVVTQANQLAGPFQISFGGTAATASYDGLAPSFVGLYQFNVVVPAIANNDLVPITFTLNGTAGTQTLYTAVHQ